MALYPQIQKLAQKELDTVLAKGAMPTFGDRPHLHYIEAVAREAFRWHPPAPQGKWLHRFF
jgi:cytochrome P450